MKKYISALLAAAFSASTFAALESPITASTVINSPETVNSQLIVKSLDGKSVQLKISGPGALLTSTQSNYAINLGENTSLLIEFDGGLNITPENSGVSISKGASMLVNSVVGDVKMAKVVVWGGTLTINKENAFSYGDVGTTLMFVDDKSYMELNASQSFNRMDIRYNSKIKFSDGVTLNFRGIDIYNSSPKVDIDIVLEDFSNTNSICFGSASGLSLTDGVLTVSNSTKSVDYTFKDKTGEIMKNLVLDTATNTLTLASIPEPSTYAAVFGALALGLALYRRRK